MKTAYRKRCLANAKALSREKRQLILDHIRSGLTIAAISKIEKVEDDTIVGIYMLNQRKKIITELNEVTK